MDWITVDLLLGGMLSLGALAFICFIIFVLGKGTKVS